MNLRDVELVDLAQQLMFLQRQVYHPDEGRDFTIYGADDRRDLYQVADPRRAHRRRLRGGPRAPEQLHPTTGDGTPRLKTRDFRVALPICAVPPEPFLGQPVLPSPLPFGSGFLVAPDVIATAGHCIDPAILAATRFVFGFRMKNATCPT